MTVLSTIFISDLPSESAPTKRPRPYRRRFRNLLLPLNPNPCPNPQDPQDPQDPAHHAPTSIADSSEPGPHDAVSNFLALAHNYEFTFGDPPMAETWRQAKLARRLSRESRWTKAKVKDAVQSTTTYFKRMRMDPSLLANSQAHMHQYFNQSPDPLADVVLHLTLDSFFKFPTNCFPLLALPWAIREIIYRLALLNHSTHQATKEEPTSVKLVFAKSAPHHACATRVSPSAFALLCTCRQVFFEGLPIFIRSNNFYLRISAFPKSLSPLGPALHDNLQHLNVLMDKRYNFKRGVLEPLYMSSRLPCIKTLKIRWQASDKAFLKVHDKNSRSSAVPICQHISTRSDIYARLIDAFGEPTNYKKQELFLYIDFVEMAQSRHTVSKSDYCVYCQLIKHLADLKTAKEFKSPFRRWNPIQLQMFRLSRHSQTHFLPLEPSPPLPLLVPEAKSARAAKAPTTHIFQRCRSSVAPDPTGLLVEMTESLLSLEDVCMS